ncbi:MAG: hypothetical protein HCA25_11155 [Dolichospermum sp. DET50]|nr:hypothetical protein [Dolichospermum sp. DET66]MBS3032819.1 hypothetical protein [Dolichospermum sp. DET67]MBS3038025.1 hypothetical protein [Dolichospermum sp. DET50]QSX69936.1 MAG: hypothetical protein EZY12_10365 [Dolichospermum sp. DET69]
MSYLLFTKDNNQQQNIDTQGFRNAVKYNLIIKVFLDIFSQSQQLNTKFEKLTGDNESLKQKIEKFEQQITILHQEYQTILELTNKLQIQNTIFNQRNQDLETNQKSFIQKLGGIVYKENLEDKTWDLVLEKTQLLMNERNEALIKIQAFNRENEVLKQENKFLTQEKNNFNQSQEILKSIITTKDGDINSLTQKLRVLESQINELQSKHDHNIELQNIQSELNKVQSLIIQKDGFIQHLEIEKGENLQKISSLEAIVITEKSNCESLTQEKMILNSLVQQLEEEIKVLNDKPIDSDIERLESQIAQKDNEIKKLEFEKNQNLQKINQLEIQLTEKESQLKTTIEDSDNRIQELEKERDSLTRNLRDVEWELSVLKTSGSSVLIAQKDTVIKKLESEKSEILERLNSLAESFDELAEDFSQLTEDFNKLTSNFNEKEYQLEVVTREKEVVTREKNYLDNRVKELEGEKSFLIQKLRDKESEVSKLQQDILFLNDRLIDRESEISELEEIIEIMPKPNIIEELEQYLEELEQDLENLEKYVEDLEQYAEDLENYYLEKLEPYSDTPDINELEKLQKQINEKDNCIRNLKSYISLLLENQSLKELEQYQ